MDNIDLMLNEKENLYRIIKSETSLYNVVTLKANIPGIVKNNNNSKLLLDIFNKKINFYNPIDSKYYKLLSGDVIIYHFLKSQNLKKKMIKLEEEPLGRFVDIDFYKDATSIKRSKPRKCFLCDNIAFYCIKNRTHSIIELNSFINDNVYNYLKNETYIALNYAFDRELNLNPKFGLVSKWSNGSHKDMNYQMMMNSKKVIIPYLIDMFDVGYYNDINSILKPIRLLGLLAENEMLKVTNGINTYKGLIFSLGIVSASLGYYLSHYKEISLKDVIKTISSPIKNDFKDIIDNTSGINAYKKYNFLGARGNAINGYEVCFDLINSNNLKTDDDLYKAFFYLVNNVDDTVLLKRTGSLTKYKEVKDLFKEYDKKLIIPLTKYAIKNNLSFGGSADLISISLFLKRIEFDLGITFEGSKK